MDEFTGKLPEILRPGETRESWPERRREIINILMEGMYGRMPVEKPGVEAEIISERDDFAGKAVSGQARLSVCFGDVKYSFPVTYAFPNAVKPAPVFAHINFRPDVPDKYLPAEEIIDNGFGYAQVCYTDIVNDRLNGDFSDGLGEAYFRGRPREALDWGKVGMWAYSLSRLIDWLVTRPEADAKHIIAIGHSRLGKTALWAGALDERVYATCVNDSGAGGCALMRAKRGEHISDFARSGMWDWFGENYKQWAGREADMPFDAHFALSLIAPRLACLGGAELDEWADPQAEALAARYAGRAWELYDKPGLIMPDRPAEPGDEFQEGSIGFHMRAGKHFLSRTDWLVYMRFVKGHMAREA